MNEHITNNGSVVTTEDLKPCPFCGGAARLKFIGNAYTRKRAAHVTCSTFGCAIEMRVAAITQNANWCAETVVEKWNKRMVTT